jgi:hypothetical protein
MIGAPRTAVWRRMVPFGGISALFGHNAGTKEVNWARDDYPFDRELHGYMPEHAREYQRG